LKLTDKIYETGRLNGIFGALRDAAPDYWGRLLIERQLKRVDISEMDYLLYSPDDRVGALGFGVEVAPIATKQAFNRMIDLDILQQTADEILKDKSGTNSLQAQVERLLLLGTSMGGARPKTVVSCDDELWIAKFNCEFDRWNSSLVEHFILQLARNCGLVVAESKVVSVGGKDVLLVKRFDRKHNGVGYTRDRMISAMTVLRADDTYTMRDRWSYIVLVEELRKFSAMPKDDARELFKRMVFNALISNTDDHPRNHAFIASPEWQLSPAYDLTPNPMVGLDHRDLAMVCGDQGRFANMNNLISQCRRFLLEVDEAATIVNKMTNYIQSNWYKLAREMGVSDKDCDTIKFAFAYQGFFY
jgi:serine/threonine-protein kinase HipA